VLPQEARDDEGVHRPWPSLFLAGLCVVGAGCWRHAARGADAGTAPDASRLDDATVVRPASPPVVQACGEAPVCEAIDRSEIELPAGWWIHRHLPESDTLVLGLSGGEPESYGLLGASASLVEAGRVLDAIETPSAIVVLALTPEAPEPAIFVFARDTFALREQVDGAGWAGVARDGEGFGALESEHVGPGADDFLFTWHRFDASSAPIASHEFRRPRGGWISQAWMSTVGGDLVLGWFRDGCAHALWVRDGVVLGEPVLHCPAASDCAAHVLSLTPEREGRVGFVVEVDCPPVPCGGPGNPLCTPPRFLAGVLEDPTGPTRLLDTCATRRPMISLEADGLRMLATVADGLEVRWLDRELELVRAARLPDAWGAIGLGAEEAWLYQSLDGRAWRGRCAP